MEHVFPGHCRPGARGALTYGESVSNDPAPALTLPGPAAVAGAGPLVADDEVVFRYPDPQGVLDGVRLEVDWVLDGVDPELQRDAGGWFLRLPRPPAWRLEYQFTARRGGHTEWHTDPGNPRRVPNPFGEKSELRFPDYVPPAWLTTRDRGAVRSVATPAGRLDAPIGVRLWAPPGLPASTAAPLLIAHDGSDMADRGSLLSWAGAVSARRPVRVALLDPAPGLRDEWYAANTDYVDHLADVVLPAINDLVLCGPVLGLGASLGALSMLVLQRRHPGAVSALVLQSGSFFTQRHDPQERGYRSFDQVCAAVSRIAAGPDLAALAGARPVPVLMTCGAIEENLPNNRAMFGHLRSQRHPVELAVVPDGHTMIGWRDAWSPRMDELVAGLR